eukprot:Blabericola_migrator_1__2414@NODE_167_length_12152_cov_196_313198_g145_i0_p2_GENE_NODE_167_length_12152_cov_196_313198_g145_i0NODE_167_length_12152_cov_196_313198_g145_i0_p2_ORF_typecomplete_len645_score130_61_NODE_167_length_12152_cov_196_313198_g145_i033185252
MTTTSPPQATQVPRRNTLQSPDGRRYSQASSTFPVVCAVTSVAPPRHIESPTPFETHTQAESHTPPSWRLSASTAPPESTRLQPSPLTPLSRVSNSADKLSQATIVPEEDFPPVVGPSVLKDVSSVLRDNDKLCQRESGPVFNKNILDPVENVVPLLESNPFNSPIETRYQIPFGPAVNTTFTPVFDTPVSQYDTLTQTQYNSSLDLPKRLDTPQIEIKPVEPVRIAEVSHTPAIHQPLEAITKPFGRVGHRSAASEGGLTTGPSAKSRLITLAELERRLSVASLPLSAFDSTAFKLGRKKDAVSLDNYSSIPKLARRQRRRSVGNMADWWDTVSSNFPRNRPEPKLRPRVKTRRPTVRDDVTADWSSVVSTEESVSYYAVKKGRGITPKRRIRAGASMYHPPLDAIAVPRYTAAPVYGPILTTPALAENTALSPVASRSLLTCSADFKKQYPFVYQGLCKGILDIQRLIAHEIVVPIKEEVSLRRSTIRSRKAVTGAICDQLWRSLQGRFPDPSVAPKLIKRMADYFYDKIEYGIQDAEDERSFLQWLFRFDVENAIDLRQNTTIQVGKNSVLCNVEGSAHLKRRKGDFFNMVSPDVVTLNIEMVIKALFLNGGHLLEINGDSRFIDRVSAGENRFAQNFLMM